jgi:hypothetical protein
MAKAKVARFGVRVFGAGEYPGKLRDADHPIALLYYRGWWDLVNSRSIAVVGTRSPSPEGERRARQLVNALVKDDFTIVSGLAKGIDRVAHETAIEAGGRTIAVIGTPINHAYPAENRDLQERIAREFLLISQVPVKRWQSQGPRLHDEALGVVASLDDFEPQGGKLGDGFVDLAGVVAAVGPDKFELGEARAYLVEHEGGAVPILNAGRVNDDAQRQARRRRASVSCGP